jgi:uncharacterized protein involved in propanediol utilization
VNDAATFHAEIGLGQANGTFGELIQGPLGTPDNLNLVTLPIDRYSWAMFVPDPTTSEVRSDPPGKLKAQRLATALLRGFGRLHGGTLRIESELPEGKGMASSSADMVATARAIEWYLGQPIGHNLLEALMREIEPTDGVMHAGVVSYFHRRLQKNADFGEMFSCRIAYLDEGGFIDTIAYNRSLQPYSAVEVARYTRLHGALQDAFRRCDQAAIGRIATCSALLNQRRNPKRSLLKVRQICERHGALGVAVTHSGPCIGILVARDDPHFETVWRNVERDLAELPGTHGSVDTLCRERASVSRLNRCRAAEPQAQPQPQPLVRSA